MKLLKGELVRITYEREKNKIHDLVGIVRQVRKSSLVLEQDGSFVSIGYRKIKHFERCELKDKEMKEWITMHKDMTVFIEYNTKINFIRAKGKILTCYAHIFNFQSSLDEYIVDIHYDDVVQVEQPANQKPENILYP